MDCECHNLLNVVSSGLARGSWTFHSRPQEVESNHGCETRGLPSGFLQSASFLERKTFLGSFIRRIDFNKQEVGIEYTMPIPVSDGSTKTAEVLSVRGVGSAGRIRTCDPPVNSRLLYH